MLIAFFNYYYTFLQLEPKEMAEQLKRQGASIPGIRPGRATAEYVTATLQRMSILGSAFLAALSAAPTIVELLTKLQVGCWTSWPQMHVAAQSSSCLRCSRAWNAHALME